MRRRQPRRSKGLAAKRRKIRKKKLKEEKFLRGGIFKRASEFFCAFCAFLRLFLYQCKVATMQDRAVHIGGAFRLLPALLVGLALFAISFVAISCKNEAASDQNPAVKWKDPNVIKAAAAVYECRWTDTPINIDGVADEPAWKTAPVIDHFMVPGTHAKPIEATRARLLWDREYLYYFAEMDDSDVYADVTEHNGLVYTNDA